MLLLFQVCFYVGVGLTIVSLVIGNLFHFTGLDGVDGIGADFDFSLDGGGISLFPFSPLICVIFVTIFGGSGMILMETTPLGSPFIVILAAFIGAAISFVIQKFIFIPLRKAQNTSAPNLEELIGIPAKVNETIIKNGYGEITYIINGNSFCAPARAVNEEDEIRVGDEVSICWIKEHVFYVTPFNRQLD